MTGKLLRFFVLSLGASCAPAALAQSAPPPGSGRAAADAPGGDIVVTARRRAENVQTVPLSIQAFGGETLRERAVTRLSDLTQIVPGLTAQASPFGNAALTLAIRGQRQGLANIAYDPAVSVYSDEVLQARTQGLNDAFFDVSSVQVLKGPQGTLFGRNTTGGAILVTSNAPTDAFEGYVDATLGNYDLFRLEGAVNVPVAEGIALRVAGVHTRRDGYIDNPVSGRDVDDQRTDSWRASLRIAPGEGPFENRLVVSGFREADSGVAYKIVALNPALLAGAAAPDLAFYATAPFHTTNATVPPRGTRIRTFNLSNITSYDFGGVTLKNIFGYRHVRSSIFFDLDGASPLIAESEQGTREHQYSNETQLLGKAFDDRLDWVVGAYLFREKGTEVQSVAILNPASGTNTITDYSIVSETAAGYAQATYRPAFLEDVSFTAGIRYTRDKRELETRARLFNGTCRILTADVGGVPLSPCEKTVDDTFSKTTYNLSVDWQFAPGSLLYFTHRYGYQAGGFTNSATRPADFTPYQPQTVQDFELGLKTSWDAGPLRGRTNVALFRGKYDDIQRLLRFTIENPSGLPFPANRILNAASATVQGIEFDTSIRLSDDVVLSAAYTYLDASYDRYLVTSAGVTQDYSGAKFAGAPKHSVSGSLRVRVPVATDLADIHLQVDGSYQSKTVAEDTTSFDPVSQTTLARAILPGYGTVNARLDLDRIGGRPVSLSVFVKNLTKEDYYTAGIDSFTSLGHVVRLLGAPRTAGVNLVYRF